MRIVFNEKMGSAEISAPSLKMFLKTYCDMGIKKHVQIGITFISGGLMKGAIKKKRFGPRWKSKLIVILQFESGHSKRKKSVQLKSKSKRLRFVNESYMIHHVLLLANEQSINNFQLFFLYIFMLKRTTKASHLIISVRTFV